MQLGYYGAHSSVPVYTAAPAAPPPLNAHPVIAKMNDLMHRQLAARGKKLFSGANDVYCFVVKPSLVWVYVKTSVLPPAVNEVLEKLVYSKCDAYQEPHGGDATIDDVVRHHASLGYFPRIRDDLTWAQATELERAVDAALSAAAAKNQPMRQPAARPGVMVVR